MRTSLIIAIASAVMISLSSIFSTQKIPQVIFTAIENGDVRELSAYFNQNVELVVIDRTGVYNKTQAEIILRDFFAGNKPVFFYIQDQSEQINSSFAICHSENEEGIKYTIFIQVRKFGGKSLITRLHIKKL